MPHNTAYLLLGLAIVLGLLLMYCVALITRFRTAHHRREILEKLVNENE